MEPLTHSHPPPAIPDVFAAMRTAPDIKRFIESKKRIRRKTVTPGNVNISLLANSLLYGLGFTAVVDYGTYLRLVAFNINETRLVLNKTVNTHKNAENIIQNDYVNTADGVSRFAPPLWTGFYTPVNEWWQEKTHLLLNQTGSYQ